MRSVKGRGGNEKLELPEDIKRALETNHVRADFDARPAHQKSEYIAWITRAKEPNLRAKRLKQMLQELDHGGVFMRDDHPGSRK